MKKRLFSLLTSLLMAISMVGVLPAVTASAENEGTDYKKVIFNDYINKIMAEFYKPDVIAQAEKATDDVIQSYTTKDENTAALYKAISEHTSIILRGLLSKLGFVDSYEDQMKKKSITMVLNQSAVNESELKKSITKVEKALKLSKKSISNFSKLKEIMTKESKNTISGSDADKIIEGIEKKKSTIASNIGTALGVADETLLAVKFGFETFELYSIQLDYIDRFMSSVDSNSSIYESLDLIRTEMTKNPAQYFADNYLKDTVLKYIAKAADKWQPDGVGLALFVFDLYKDYISPLPSSDDIIITYYLDSYTSQLYCSCDDKCKYMVKNGADESDIESFEFRYNQYVSALRAKLKSAETMAKKNTTLKNACTKAYTALNGWNFDKFIEYVYNKLVSSGEIANPEASEGDFEYKLLSDGTIEITKYKGSATKLSIPSNINGKKVTSIYDYAFQGCYNLTSITIPDSVSSIGGWPFSGCDSLSSITVDSNNKNYSSVDGVLFNKNKTELIKYPVRNIRKSYSIPNSVESIRNHSFSECTNLTSITIPYSVTSIGGYTFDGSSSLTSIAVDSNNKEYSSKDGVLFDKNKTELIKYPIGNTRTAYSIPNGVKTIWQSAFLRCKSLTSVTIPNSVTSIYRYAFQGCYNLTSITIPDSVKIIGGSAFIYTPWLTNKQKQNPLVIVNGVLIDGTYCKGKITIPNSVKTIGYDAFRYCDNLTSITIPNSVTSIGDYAFCNRKSLTSVTIGSSVTSINSAAFYYCDNLTSITIPNSVKIIGPSVFYGCKNLKDVYYFGTKDEWNNIYFGSFDSDLSNATIHYHTHSYTSKVTKKATCTAKGVKTYTCSCGRSYTESIPAAGHKFGSWTVTKKATCTKTGTKTRKCSVCGKVESQSIKAKGHSYKKVTSKSTFFVKGYTFNKCSVCGATSSKKALPLLVMNAPKAASTTQTSIKLSWSKATGASGYCVYQKKSGKWAKIKTTTSTTFTVSKLKAGYAYQFLVKPYKKSGKSVTWGSCSKVLTKSTVPLKNNDYYYRVNGKNIEIIKYKGKSSNVTIPSTISGKRVTVLRKSAFSGSKLNSVNIPGTILTISELAFYNCTNLSKVTINNGVKTIGFEAFSMCTKLKSIKLPKSITSIGYCGVGYCINDEYHSMDIDYTLNFRIYCYRNSYAHKYAIREGIKYTLL